MTTKARRSSKPKYIVADLVLWRSDAADRVTILKFKHSGDYFKIEGPPATLWKQLAEGKSIEDINKNLAKKYSRLIGDVRSSTQMQINKLLKFKLLKEV